MRKLLLSSTFFLFCFFLFTSAIQADTVQCNATVIGGCSGDSACIDAGNGTCACSFSITCQKPSPLCCTTQGGCQWQNGSNIQTIPQWSFFTGFTCANATYNGPRQEGTGTCQFNYSQCSAADRCQDFSPNVNNVSNQPPGPQGGGGTGNSPNGVILPGICNEAGLQYDASGNLTNPGQACLSGNPYKQCCQSNGQGPVSACLNGSCPNGIWVSGTSCPTPAPTPPPITYACSSNGACVQSSCTPGSAGCFSNDSTCGGGCPTPTPTATCQGNTTLTCGQGCTLFGTISGNQCFNVSTGSLCALPTCQGGGVGGGGGPPPPPPTPPPPPPQTTPPPWGCTYTSYICPSSCQGGGQYLYGGNCFPDAQDSDTHAFCGRRVPSTGCYDANDNYCGQPSVSSHYCPTTNFPTWQYPWWEPNPPPQCGNTEWACYCPSWGLGFPIPISQNPICHSQPGDNSTCSSPSTSCSSQNNCYIGGGNGCSGGCTYQANGPCIQTKTVGHGENADEICIQYGPAGCYDASSNYCGPQASFNGVTCTTTQNCLTTSCQSCTASSTSACQAPTPPPTYTVAGNVFVDTNNNTIKDGSEQNYAGSINIGSTGGSVTEPPGAGTFNVSGLVAGSYTVSYTNLPSGAIMTYPLNGPPPSFTLTVGGSCSVGGSNSAFCFSGNIANLNFGINYNKPWIQCQGADCRIDSGFVDKLPPSTYANTNGSGGTPGLIFTGNATPDFGQGQASSTNWVVGGPLYSETYSPTQIGGTVKTSYSYLLSKAGQANTTPTDISAYCSGGISNCNLQQLPHGVYRANGNLNLVGGGFTFPTGANYVILVNGNLTIDERISVPNGSTAVFSATGNITVAKTLGETSSSASSTIEGIYSADQSFIADGNNSCNIGADLRLNIAGSVITNAGGLGGSFQNKRDLCGDDLLYPTVAFFERVDLILNTPDFLKSPNFTYQEIAP